MASSTAGRMAGLSRAARHATLGRWDLPLLLLCLSGVVWIRLQLLLATDFPINDGALFFAFVQAHVQVFPHLPVTVDFNGLAIPYAYPPLSFWLAAAAVQLGADPLALVHRVPILMNIGWVFLFAALLRRTGHSQLFTAIAVLVFGTGFRSYEWLVMGGGLSRGMGSLFFLAMLLALLPPGLRRARRWNWTRVAAGGVFLGATLLSHLEWGLLGVFCGLVALLLAKPTWRDFLKASVAFGGTAACLVLPWIAAVAQSHGLQPFRAASQASSWSSIRLADSGRVVLRNAGLLLPFVLFGAALVARTREAFWLLFVAASLWLVPRSGETPLVLGIGVLAATGVLGAAVALHRTRSRSPRWAFPALALAACALMTVRAEQAGRPHAHLAALAPELRQAMAWMAANHPGAHVAVLRDGPWESNASAEWFPVLAGGTSTTTVQGREWLPDGAFQQAQESIRRLNASSSCAELFRALDRFSPAQYLWVESIDLGARARARDDHRQRNVVADALDALQRRWRAARGDARMASSLRGSGTAGGCVDAAGWRPVHENARVRIFEAPGTAVPPVAP